MAELYEEVLKADIKNLQRKSYAEEKDVSKDDISNDKDHSNVNNDDSVLAKKEVWTLYLHWVSTYGSMRSEQRQILKDKITKLLEELSPVEYLNNWMWNIMIACIKDGALWSPYEANLAFLHLEQYALNLAWYPWKREMQLIHTNSGFFFTRVARVIADAVKVLEHLGYEETFQDIYMLEKSAGIESVQAVALECFKAAVECSYQEKLLASFLKGNPHLSWEQKCEAARCILKCRENGLSECEECFEAIWDDLRLMKISYDNSPLAIKSFSHESLISNHATYNSEPMERFSHSSMSKCLDSRPSSTENLLTVHSDGSYKSTDRPKITAATFQSFGAPWQGIGDTFTAELIKEKKSSKTSLNQYDEENYDVQKAPRVKAKPDKCPTPGEKSPSEKRKFKTLIEKVAKRDPLESRKMLQNVVKQFSNVGHILNAMNAKKRIGELVTAAENLKGVSCKSRTIWYTDDTGDADSIKSEQDIGERVIKNSKVTYGSLKLSKTHNNSVSGYADGTSLTCPRCHWSSATCDSVATSTSTSLRPPPPIPPPPPILAKRSLIQNLPQKSHLQSGKRQSGGKRFTVESSNEGRAAADALMDELVQKLVVRRSQIEAGELTTFNSIGKLSSNSESGNLVNELKTSPDIFHNSQIVALGMNNGINENSVESSEAVKANGIILSEDITASNILSLSRTSSRLNAIAGGLSAIAEDEELHSIDDSVNKDDVNEIPLLISNRNELNACNATDATDVISTVSPEAADKIQSPKFCVHCPSETGSIICCMCCRAETLSQENHLENDETGCPQCPSCTPAMCLLKASPTLVQ